MPAPPRRRQALALPLQQQPTAAHVPPLPFALAEAVCCLQREQLWQRDGIERDVLSAAHRVRHVDVPEVITSCIRTLCDRCSNDDAGDVDSAHLAGQLLARLGRLHYLPIAQVRITLCTIQQANDWPVFSSVYCRADVMVDEVRQAFSEQLLALEH